jgi:hypothetical protein
MKEALEILRAFEVALRNTATFRWLGTVQLSPVGSLRRSGRRVFSSGRKNRLA